MNVDPGSAPSGRGEQGDGRVAGAAGNRGDDRGSGRGDGWSRQRVKTYDVGPDARVYRSRAHRRRRLGRHRRRAYIRSVYFLPSLATLGNAVCGFGAMYVAAFDDINVGDDPWAKALLTHKFLAAAYLLLLAMVFDALDGRLARFARHTTDFGGQLDSLADVVSFGAAPAFIVLMLFKDNVPADIPLTLSRLIWAIGALYFSCAAIRLARFNVSNEHGEQHHFSFLGLPSPGAAAAVIGAVMIQQDLRELGLEGYRWAWKLSRVMTWTLPVIVLAAGLLMVSAIRYPHVINRYLRGRRSIARLLGAVAILLGVVVAHRYVFGVAAMAYALYGPSLLAFARLRPRPAGFPVGPAPAARSAPTPPPDPLPPSPAPR